MEGTLKRMHGHVGVVDACPVEQESQSEKLGLVIINNLDT